MFNQYRITGILKVETGIITSIVASPTGRAVILVKMFVEIFKTGVIVLSVLNVDNDTTTQ